MIPYLKKGSPIIVFGELSKPEIFTDRDGRSQVSMNITAQSLQFSPFGRPDNNAPGGHAPAQEKQFGQSQDQSQGQNQSHDQGQAQQQSASEFADEEIPF